MFSEELRILDRNTVTYMVDEMGKEIEEQKQQIANLQAENAELRAQLNTNRKG